MIMNKLGLSTAAVLGLSTACGLNDDTLGRGVDYCDDMVPWDLDEPVPEGFTPREVLDAVEGVRQGTLTWNGSGSSVLVEPDSGETEVTVQVRYTGGDILYPAEDSFCEEQTLWIELVMDFATADGAFAETWAVTGTAYAEGVLVGLSLDELGVQGTFSAVPETDDPYYYATAVLHADISAESSTGAIEVSEGYEKPSDEPGGGSEGGVSAPYEAATWEATPSEG